MDSLGKNSAAYISYLIINFLWYLAIAVVSILLLAMIYSFWNPEAIDLNASVPIDPSMVTMQNDIPFLEVDEVKGTLALSYLVESKPGFYTGWCLYILAISALFLYGFNQLRQVLKATVYDAIFTAKNIARLKKLAFIVMAFDPLKWIYYIVFVSQVGSFSADLRFEIGVVSFQIGFILTGLLLYVLATVFENGFKMYEELKLTV